MSLDPIYGNLTNLIHENILPNQIKNAHFLPVGKHMPDGIKVLENPVSCVFLSIFMNPLANSWIYVSSDILDFFYQDFF